MALGFREEPLQTLLEQLLGPNPGDVHPWGVFFTWRAPVEIAGDATCDQPRGPGTHA